MRFSLFKVFREINTGIDYITNYILNDSYYKYLFSLKISLRNNLVICSICSKAQKVSLIQSIFLTRAKTTDLIFVSFYFLYFLKLFSYNINLSNVYSRPSTSSIWKIRLPLRNFLLFSNLFIKFHKRFIPILLSNIIS